MRKEFTENDFTQGELQLLKLIFAVGDSVVDSLREDRYDVDKVNDLYNLKHKLGIYDLIEEY